MSSDHLDGHLNNTHAHRTELGMQNYNGVRNFNNFVDARSSHLMYAQMSGVRPSQTMTSATLKTQKCFRRISRMIPFILRIHGMNHEISVHEARANVARLFRENSHLRNPLSVDNYVNTAYSLLHDAEFKYSEASILREYILYDKYKSAKMSFNYLEKKKFEDKSKFLMKFYKGSTPNI